MIRLRADEHREIIEAAKAKSLTTSSFIRMVALEAARAMTRKEKKDGK